MKYIRRDILSILLIALIGMSSISATSLTIKSHKSRRRTHKKSLSKIKRDGEDLVTASDSIFKIMKENFTNILKISFFIMGIISVKIPKIHEIFQKVVHIENYFQNCQQLVMPIWNKLFADDAAKADEEQSYENKLKTEEENSDKPAKKQQECEKSKEEFAKLIVICIDEKHADRSTEETRTNSMNEIDYCNYPLLEPCPKTKEKIMKIFDSEDNYKEMCKKYRGAADCNALQESEKRGGFYFAKKAVKFIKFFNQCKNCIVVTLKLGGGSSDSDPAPAYPEIKELSESAFGVWQGVYLAAKGALKVCAFACTFSIFGFLRGIWTIIKIALEIKKIFSRPNTDLPYYIGRLIGLVIKAISAFSSGRRRLRK
jgi:hypothetical protein